MLDYIADFFYGATKYPCALFKPAVFVGYFGNGDAHRYQKKFFEKLLSLGFERTLWQLVFPGQTAGIIQKVPIADTGANEYHIRFYEDGTIECELEVDRWSPKHWTGFRHHGSEGVEFLLDILDKEFDEMPVEWRNQLSKLFGAKHFTLECVRKT